MQLEATIELVPLASGKCTHDSHPNFIHLVGVSAKAVSKVLSGAKCMHLLVVPYNQ